MTELPPDLVLDGISLDKLKKIRAEASKRIRNEKKRLKFKANVEIPAEYREPFERAAEWAYTHKLIKRRSRWAFCKFAITNSIDFIMKQIEKEELMKVQAAAQISPQMHQEPQTPAQGTQTHAKTA